MPTVTVSPGRDVAAARCRAYVNIDGNRILIPSGRLLHKIAGRILTEILSTHIANDNIAHELPSR